MIPDHKKPQAPVEIAVLGLGYVGCVTAACLAELGHHVIGVDRDEYKVKRVREGCAPFYEPGLGGLVGKNCAAGRLCATTSLAQALNSAEMAFICVGTPPGPQGMPALDQLHRVCGEIKSLLPSMKRPLIVVIRSTVFPDACEAVAREFREAGAPVSVVINPEFLREGSAVHDFMEPSLVVVGGDDATAVERVAGLYSVLSAGVRTTSPRAAAMVKFACNAFHAVKVDFANEIGGLCARLGISGDEVMEAVRSDAKLNASPAYLKPGFAFGGSCLSKDVLALVGAAAGLNMRLPLLESALPSNDEHLERAKRAVLGLPAERLGVVGLAFKENTDDLRGSAVLPLLDALLASGRSLRVFDPQIRLDRIYGSNLKSLLSAIPEVEKVLAHSLEDLLTWADHIVIVQSLPTEISRQIASSGLPVLNLAATT